MLEEVRSAVATLKAMARELEPGCLDGRDALELLDDVIEAGHVCDALRALLARRVDETGVWRGSGERSAAHFLSSRAGESVGSAMASLDTAVALDGLSATAEAFRAGRLSGVQAAAITGAARLDPSAEPRLLAAAKRSTVKGLKDRCREVRAAAQADDADWARRLHESRYLHTWTSSDGAFCLDARLAPEAGAKLHAALKAHQDQIFQAARRAGERGARDAYAADALVALAEHGPTKPVEIHLTADAAAIARGNVQVGERCELRGVGPVPVTTARALMADARITTMVRDGDAITHVSSPTRTVPAKLRRWLDATYPTCGVIGCECEQDLEVDHVEDFALTHDTSEANTWLLCRWHHILKTYFGWTVAGEGAERTLVPPHSPDDPDPP